MEIEITDFYHNQDTRIYSDSINNSGCNDIGQITWNNALHSAHTLITTEEARQAVLNLVEEMGMEDIAGMNMNEANALFIQLISGDIQEKEGMTWKEYQNSDQVTGRLFENDGKIYYLIV